MTIELRRLVGAYQIADTEHVWGKAFYVRGDLLRPGFGAWDSCDPIAHAILDVVEAQTELADAIMDFAEGPGSEAACEAAIQAAQVNRRAAVRRACSTKPLTAEQPIPPGKGAPSGEL